MSQVLQLQFLPYEEQTEQAKQMLTLKNDELAFLFNNAVTTSFIDATIVKQTNSFTNMLLSGSDPLSLLNQHFQPPEIKLPTTPIAVASSTEILISSLAFTEGNILRDLGFYDDHDFGYVSETYTNALPAACVATFGYRDDENQSDIPSPLEGRRLG